MVLRMNGAGVKRVKDVPAYDAAAMLRKYAKWRGAPQKAIMAFAIGRGRRPEQVAETVIEWTARNPA
jgi:hypothetical protein